jgi:hypothetical protein
MSAKTENANDLKPMDIATKPSNTDSKSALFEPLALVLLSLATVGTAWCSYQAAAWGGTAGGFMNRSTAASRQAAADQLKSQQIALLDVLLFSQYINARSISNEPLARFYADRFRDEAKTAFQAWLATQPFTDPNAPPHPFVTNFYRPRLLEEARQAEADSQRLEQQAGLTGRISRNYVLITVLLACALFCGATASKFEKLWIRRAVVLLGLATFLFALGRAWVLPAQF